MDRHSLFRSAAASGLLGIAATAAQSATETGVIAAPLVTGPHGPMPPLPQLTDYGELRGEMLYRKLGWTGESVSAIGSGGSHFPKPGIDQATSIRPCHAVLDGGMNFMDNSWDYNKGESEARMGVARSQSGHRNRAFLMTRVDGRNKDIGGADHRCDRGRGAERRVRGVQDHRAFRRNRPKSRLARPGPRCDASTCAQERRPMAGVLNSASSTMIPGGHR